MKAALFCLPLLFACCVFADEADDQAVITKVVQSLVNPLPAYGPIAASPAATAELERLRLGTYVLRLGDAKPTVVISHDPWGEATILIPPMSGSEPVVARIAVGEIRFVTPDVVLVDTDWSLESNQKALLLVMTKVEGKWLVASAREVRKTP